MYIDVCIHISSCIYIFNVGITMPFYHPCLGMVNIHVEILTIYGDDWGMVYYCYTHIL